MDSLKSLLDSKKYYLVLKLTEKSSKGEDLFYRIVAYTCLGRYEDALFVIQDHQEELEKTNMASLIKIHIELLCVLERYEQAQATLDYYSDLPYQSQVVEETLREMPKVIEQEERKYTSKCSSDDEVFEKLNSSDKDENIFALDLIRKRDIFTFLPDIAKLLVKNPNQVVRSIALMLLVEKEVDRNLEYLSSEGLIKINPKHLNPPFASAVFNETLRILDRTYKDATISQNGAQILSTYVIYTYPKELDKSEKEIACAIFFLAKKMMSFEVDLDALCKEQNLDLEKVNNYIRSIDNCLKEM